MTYEDSGFNRQLTKNNITPLAEYSEADTSTSINSISGTKISGGVSTGKGGKIVINWSTGEIRQSNAIGQEIARDAENNRDVYYDGGVPTMIVGELPNV